MSEYDKEITQRYASDMMSDSWLSKNIRPLALAFLTVATVILAYLTIFILDARDVELLKPWLNLLQSLLIVICFLFWQQRLRESAGNKETPQYLKIEHLFKLFV